MYILFLIRSLNLSDLKLFQWITVTFEFTKIAFFAYFIWNMHIFANNPRNFEFDLTNSCGDKHTYVSVFVTFFFNLVQSAA